ncbi:DUF3592 domain-containing protein [Tenuifilum thalassicum]|uniref:DUF3592 domain-containing protein n=1 Tax=Tenuifilum thalassicum TaxID=2590900 RepID=A0A7D3XUQ4_9BACT|nr:DUF3592 domain-containing protein [Tenuifilum thalassicum]QKG79248.1 hypothetical protein FHG85_02870 [Tenuifilum thalassicum]
MKSKADISFKISRKLFWFITIMILLLPITTRYRLLIWGEYTKGVVVGVEDVQLSILQGLGPDKFPVIQFATKDRQIIEFFGPENFDYPIGKELWVVYDTENPNKNTLLTLGALYASKKSILPGILFIIWMAFYFAFKTNN